MHHHALVSNQGKLKISCEGRKHETGQLPPSALVKYYFSQIEKKYFQHEYLIIMKGTEGNY